MAGVLIPFLPETHYNFSYLGASATETVRLAGAIPVSDYVSAVLLVRLHTNNNSAGTVALKAYPAAPSMSDPRAYVDATADLSVSFTTDTAPKLLKDSTSTIGGGHYAIYLEVTQNATPATLAFQISADLLVRRNN